jgi:hypothetical protein
MGRGSRELVVLVVVFVLGNPASAFLGAFEPAQPSYPSKPLVSETNEGSSVQCIIQKLQSLVAIKPLLPEAIQAGLHPRVIIGIPESVIGYIIR